MDETMKMMYRALHELDVNNCLALPKPTSLEIQIGKEYQPMSEFIRNSARLVTLDQYSSRSGMSTELLSHFPTLFLEVNIQYAVFKQEGKSVGYGVNVMFHNGFPKVVSSEQLKDITPKGFEELWERTVKILAERKSIEDATAKPEIGVFATYYLHRDFVKEHPIYRVNRNWGFKSREKLFLEGN